MRKNKKLPAIILSVICLFSALCIPASAHSIASGTAEVSSAYLRIRSGANDSCAVMGRALRGAVVVVLGRSINGWYHINYNGVDGYVPGKYLTNIKTVSELSLTGVVNNDDVRLRTEPNTGCDTLGYYSSGAKMTVTGIENGWLRLSIAGRIGYMRSDYVKITGKYNAPDPADPSGVSYAKGVEIAEFARSFVGYDYVYGGASPDTGFDCSGLVYYVYGQFGYSIPHGATSQYNQSGYEVAYESLQPGDVVFFANPDYGEGITHVGIYLGNDEFVHASDYDVGVIISKLSNRIGTYYGAKRIVE